MANPQREQEKDCQERWSELGGYRRGNVSPCGRERTRETIPQRRVENPLTKSAHQGVAIIGRDHTVERLSAHLGDLLGWTSAVVPGMPVQALFPRAEIEAYGRLFAGIDAVLKGASAAEEGRLSLASPDGCEVPIYWSTYPVGDGEEGCSAVLVVKAATAGAGAPDSLESYRETFEYAVEGIFRTTLDGRYLVVNPALAKIYGYESPAELMRRLRDVRTQLYVKEGRRTEFVRLMQIHGFVSDFESEIYRADGTTVWIAEYARTVYGPDGVALYFEGSVVDITGQVRMIDALRENRERFRRLVESVNLVPWEAEWESGQIAYAGPQAEELLGFPMKEWLTEDFWVQRLHPEDRSWATVARAEGLSKRKTFESEYRMLTADGRTVWVRDIVTRRATEDGREIMVGFMLDITHRRMAEESLRETRQFTESVAAASPVIWYVYVVELNAVVYVDGGGIELLGYTKEALMKMEPVFLLSLAHPSEEAQWQEHRPRLLALKRGAVIEREFRLRGADGNWIWMRTYECAFKQDAEGRTVEIVGVAENITIQRAAVEQLEENEELFRKLAEMTRVIPLEMDLATQRFLYVGPQAAPLLGYPLNKWYGASFWRTTVHEEDAEVVEGLFREALENPNSDIDVEFRMRTETGEFKWLRQIVRRGLGEEKECRGFLIDISAAKAMEAEREETRKQLRELAMQGQKLLEEERMRVAREIHDELGQALTLLRIDLAWLGGRVNRLLPGEPGAPLMEKMEGMERQLEATLQAARRITTALRPPVLDEFGLAEAIEWQANDFSRRAGIRCQVHTQFQSNVPKEVETAAFRIFQEILTNVARHAKATRVEVRLEQSADSLWLSVRDNGCGFNPGAAKKKAGFGLLGMRERVEGSGGRLVIMSTPGEGTTISVTLPIQFGEVG